MKHLMAITAVLLWGSLHCFADGSYTLQWQKGNSFYEQKQYDSAAYCYEQIAALRPLNAELYYNLGNTYYRLNKIGRSILNYERALKVKPGYPEAKDNLLLAQSRVTNNIHPAGEIFFIRWWKAITFPGNATALSVMALVLFLLFIGLLTAKRMKKLNSPVQLRVALIFLCSFLLLLAFFSTRQIIESTGAVIMENDTPLMNRELKGKPLTLLPEGVVVKIISERTDWIEVMLPDGWEGWLRQDAVARI